jgi:hypothetical protein
VDFKYKGEMIWDYENGSYDFTHVLHASLKKIYRKKASAIVKAGINNHSITV